MAGSERIDNKNNLAFKQAIGVIKKLIFEELPQYKFDREYYEPTGYWGAFFSKDDITIFLGSERGIIDYGLNIKEEKIYLPEFDRRLDQLEATSETNFHFIIQVMKRYLSNSRAS
jgi:hypothetical protein